MFIKLHNSTTWISEICYVQVCVTYIFLFRLCQGNMSRHATVVYEHLLVILLIIIIIIFEGFILFLQILYYRTLPCYVFCLNGFSTLISSPSCPLVSLQLSIYNRTIKNDVNQVVFSLIRRAHKKTQIQFKLSLANRYHSR